MYFSSAGKVWPCSPTMSSAILLKQQDGTISGNSAKVILNIVSKQYLEIEPNYFNSVMKKSDSNVQINVIEANNNVVFDYSQQKDAIMAELFLSMCEK